MFASLPFRHIAFLFFALSLPATLLAQSAGVSSSSYSSQSLPNAPSAHPLPLATSASKSPYEKGGYAGSVRAHVACGGGLDFLQGGSQGALALCGAGFTFIPYTALEIGGIRLQDGSAHFYLSEDFVAPITPLFKRLRGDPIGIVGYTKIVGNSNRFDYGVGWEHHLGPSASIGLEARDYLQFTSPVQHAVVLRFVLVGGGDWAD